MIASPSIDLNIQDANGETPILFAMKNGKLATAKMLASSAGVDFNLEDNDGNRISIPECPVKL